MVPPVAAAQAEHVVKGQVRGPRRLRVPRAVAENPDAVEHRVDGLPDDEQEAAERLADGAVILEVGRSSGPDSMPLRWDR